MIVTDDQEVRCPSMVHAHDNGAHGNSNGRYGGIQMNILAISGSPRPARNTAGLMKLIVESAKAHVSNVDAMWCNLNDMTYSGCQSCLACKEPTARSCVRKDALAFVLDVMVASQAWVIGTPVYMGHVSGQLKLLLDRMYGFIGPNWENRLPAGKRVVVAITQGAGEECHRDLAEELAELLGRRGLETRVIRACNMRVDVPVPEFSQAVKEEAAALGKWLAGAL
jgi:NAD(P)H-dependent FMN reductase